MTYHRGQMKKEVKQTLRHTKPNPILIALLFFAILYAGNWLINKGVGTILLPSRMDSLVSEALETVIDLVEASESNKVSIAERRLNELKDLFEEFAQMGVRMALGSMLIGVLTYLWSNMMNVGYKGHCLSVVRGEQPPVSNLFCAFPKTVDVVIARILVGVFVFLWSLLFTVIYAVAVGISIALDMDMVSVLLIFLATVAYIIGIIWIPLRYALTDYALLDQDLSGSEAIGASKRMMRGNAGRLFVLELSFFGWRLLQGLIMFLGTALASLLAVGSLAVVFDSYSRFSLMEVISALGIAVVPLVPAAVITFMIELWLVPYITGCTARFYDMILAQSAGGAEAPTVEQTAPTAPMA